MIRVNCRRGLLAEETIVSPSTFTLEPFESDDISGNFMIISVPNQRAVSTRLREEALELPALVNQGLTSLFLESRGILGAENEAART